MFEYEIGDGGFLLLHTLKVEVEQPSRDGTLSKVSLEHILSIEKPLKAAVCGNDCVVLAACVKAYLTKASESTNIEAAASDVDVNSSVGRAAFRKISRSENLFQQMASRVTDWTKQIFGSTSLQAKPSHAERSRSTITGDPAAAVGTRPLPIHMKGKDGFLVLRSPSFSSPRNSALFSTHSHTREHRPTLYSARLVEDGQHGVRSARWVHEREGGSVGTARWIEDRRAGAESAKVVAAHKDQFSACVVEDDWSDSSDPAESRWPLPLRTQPGFVPSLTVLDGPAMSTPQELGPTLADDGRLLSQYELSNAGDIATDDFLAIDTGPSEGVHNSASEAPQAESLEAGTIDVLVLNLNDDGFGLNSGNSNSPFAHCDEDHFETMERLSGEIPEVLSDTGVAYVVFSSQRSQERFRTKLFSEWTPIWANVAVLKWEAATYSTGPKLSEVIAIRRKRSKPPRNIGRP